MSYTNSKTFVITCSKEKDTCYCENAEYDETFQSIFSPYHTYTKITLCYRYVVVHKCLTVKKKKKFPVAISLSWNTSVWLEAADFYERRQVELHGKDGVYTPSTYMLPLQ